MLAKGYEDAKYGYSWFLLRHATSYMVSFNLVSNKPRNEVSSRSGNEVAGDLGPHFQPLRYLSYTTPVVAFS